MAGPVDDLLAVAQGHHEVAAQIAPALSEWRRQRLRDVFLNQTKLPRAPRAWVVGTRSNKRVGPSGIGWSSTRVIPPFAGALIRGFGAIPEERSVAPLRTTSTMTPAAARVAATAADRCLVFSEAHSIVAEMTSQELLSNRELLQSVNLIHAHSHLYDGESHEHEHEHGGSHHHC
jgi:hypothetical protein